MKRLALMVAGTALALPALAACNTYHSGSDYHVGGHHVHSHTTVVHHHTTVIHHYHVSRSRKR